MYVVIVPAYQPDATLVDICQGLIAAMPERASPKVIVVDDGSTAAGSAEVFERLRELPSVRVLAHAYNQGKGAALKTAFAYVLEHLPQMKFVVTADADGQHLVGDIIAVGNTGIERGEAVLGVRTFSSDVPLRSRFGNKLTRLLFRAILGTDISDTQTGLRAIPRSALTRLLSIEYNRYNFEFEALIAMVKLGKVHQLPIQTVYQPGNPTSHFNPLLDSARIYAILFRHVSLIAVISLGDIMLFSAFSAMGLSVLRSLICSRTISTIIYFVVARQVVFRAQGNPIVQIGLFMLLVAGNIALLAPFISMANEELGLPKPVAMAIGTLFLFVSNFLWQNYIIFQRKREEQ